MKTPPAYVGRFAPAPTGALHLGNARTFLLAWLRCRSSGGSLFLRIEDLEHPKVKPGTVGQLLEDLRWLGLDWDRPHRRPIDQPAEGQADDQFVQSHRLLLYRSALERLRDSGRIYPCVCTRRDIEAAQAAPHEGEELLYPGSCRGRFPDAAPARVASGRDPAWRFRIDDARETTFTDVVQGPQRSRLAEWSGDFVVARSWSQPAYQLAVVVDDAAMAVTEVVRGDDLLPSTHRQLALYDALGLEPPAFAHVPLVVGPDGRRLAKRHGDTRISAFRAAGITAERLIAWLAMTCGLACPSAECQPADLIGRFDLGRLPLERVVIGRDRLRALGLVAE